MYLNARSWFHLTELNQSLSRGVREVQGNGLERDLKRGNNRARHSQAKSRPARHEEWLKDPTSSGRYGKFGAVTDHRRSPEIVVDPEGGG